MSIFNFEKLYDVGNHLKDFSKDEEYQRSSISRYYYSVFHPVRDYYEKSFRRILPQDNIHSNLINELENSPFKEEQKLGNDIRKLRNNRNYADYTQKRLRKKQTIESKKKTDEINNAIRLSKKAPITTYEEVINHIN